MILGALLSILVSTSVAAPQQTKPKDLCEHSAFVARSALSSIYTAQKATFEEYKSYSENFEQIGFEAKNIDSCDIQNWEFDIAVDVEGKQFIAQAKSKLTQDIWIIDHNKHLVKVY